MWEWFLHNGMFFLLELANALQGRSASSSDRFYGAAQRSVQKRAQALHIVNGAGTAPYGPHGAVKLSACGNWPLNISPSVIIYLLREYKNVSFKLLRSAGLYSLLQCHFFVFNLLYFCI